eukprot:SAG31_NODE_13202_length_886_cov_1.127065_1_plen_148_part_10
MYYGGGNSTRVNNESKPLPFDFVALTLIGRTDGFMIKGGDATRGQQHVMYDGPRPFETAKDKHGGYQPMNKSGAIILATGGDNSNDAFGCFYEGFIASGNASEATNAAIQANIVSVGYSGWTPAVDCSTLEKCKRTCKRGNRPHDDYF